MRNILLATVFILSVSACQTNKGSLDSRRITYNFVDNTNGWKPFFSDYPQGAENQYQMEFSFAKLPAPFDTTLTALKLAAVNPGKDLFTCMYVPVTGLIPNATYTTTFNLWIASNIKKGEPADIALGVGGLDTIPMNIIDESNWYRPSFDTNLQNGYSNENLMVIGKLGVTDTTTVYTAIGRNNYAHPMKLTTNYEGKLYLLIGWDSGYDGKTAIYFKSIFVTLEYDSNP